MQIKYNMNTTINFLPDFLDNSRRATKVLEILDMPNFINNLRSKTENICPICFNYCIILTRINNCTHIYCNKCISKWLEMSNKCPLCRRIFDKIKII